VPRAGGRKTAMLYDFKFIVMLNYNTTMIYGFD
jgi:hypothetical protein